MNLFRASRLRLLWVLLLGGGFILSHGQGWEQTYDHPDDAVAYRIEQTPDQGFLLLGSTADSLFEIKVDADGLEQWRSSAALSQHQENKSRVYKNSGADFLIGGQSPSAGTNHASLYKTNANGDSLWLRLYNGNYQGSTDSASGIYDVLETPDGGYIAAGNYLENYGSVEMDAVLFKTDSAGNLQWDLKIGSLGLAPLRDYHGRVVQLTHDGNYAISGHYVGATSGIVPFESRR